MKIQLTRPLYWGGLLRDTGTLLEGTDAEQIVATPTLTGSFVRLSDDWPHDLSPAEPPQIAQPTAAAPAQPAPVAPPGDDIPSKTKE
jgi:hypothetical protein